MLRHNPSVAKQYYIILQDKFIVITYLTMATYTTNQAIYLASMGDQLDFPKPVSIAVAKFEGHIITLTTRCDATTYTLPSSPNNPVTLEGP
jgi:hypothetical protein